MDTDSDRHYARIARAIAWLATHQEDRPDLGRAAAAMGLSPWHFQREFRRWTGVSPKRFQNLLALDRGRTMLADGAPVLEAALGAGLSGPSRLHDLTVGFDAATPGEIRAGGDGIVLTYGFAESPFGRLFAAVSPRGLARLAFIEPGGDEAALAAERAVWPQARFVRDDTAASGIVRRLFAPDTSNKGAGAADKVQLAPRGTNFQVKVWQALLAIPPGAVTTYAAIARAIGQPGAARAVGGACAANPIALLIPCHRVLRGTGALGGYAWGPERKRALLAWEEARADIDASNDAVSA